MFIYTINLLLELCVLVLKSFVLSSCFICMDGLVVVLFGCSIQIISTHCKIKFIILSLVSFILFPILFVLYIINENIILNQLPLQTITPPFLYSMKST